MAPATRAFVRVMNVSRGDVSHFNRDNTAALLDNTQRAADGAEEGRQFDAPQPLAIAPEAVSRPLRVSILKATGTGGDSTRARRLADLAVHDFPDSSPAHLSRFVVSIVAGDRTEAIRELTETIRHDPTNAHFYEYRSELELEARQCRGGRARLKEIRKRGARPSMTFEERAAGCTP
jgi:hypothetical protein